LHLGSARLALLTWLLARRHGGEVYLRIGDVAAHPGRTEAAGAAETDLAWLGLTCDGTIVPTERLDRYALAAERLKRSGRLYPCLEGEQELRAKREWRLRVGKSPVYDRAMLKLTPAQLAAAEAGGKIPYWRFRLSDGITAWHDLVLGPTEVKLPAISDPVVIEADGTPLPVFTAAVDDLEHGVTHVIHGADHVAGTGVQHDLIAALGGDAAAIRFAHVPQLREAEGTPRRARLEALTLRRLRGDGMEPAAITAYFAALGCGDDVPLRALDDLAAEFDLARLDREPPCCDMAALAALNRRVLGETAFADLATRLPPGATEAFWTAIRGDIDLLGEAAGWWDVVAGTIVPPVIENETGFLRTALALLPAEPWDAGIWSVWAQALEGATGRSLAVLLPPLRLALTGEEHGPDLAALLPLIGRARAALRLQLAAA
jgi:glutamyl-tRNA synthetase